MVKGKVKWFDNKKGYGFIMYNENEEIFVHFTNIQETGFRSLSENEEVWFEIKEGARVFKQQMSKK